MGGPPWPRRSTAFEVGVRGMTHVKGHGGGMISTASKGPT